MKKILFSVIAIIAANIQTTNASAQEITTNNYKLKLNNQNQVTDVYNYRDKENTNLQRYYKVNNIKYEEEKNINEYLKHKTIETTITNGKMINTNQYRQNRVSNYLRYNNNTNFNESRILNNQDILYNYNINNNQLTKVVQYYNNSNKIYRIYQNYSNQRFVANNLGNYQRMYELNRNNTLKNRTDYFTNRKRKMYTTFYANTTFQNMANKRKERYYFNISENLTRERIYFNNSSQFKTNTTFYANTKYNNRSRGKKTQFTVTNKGILTRHVMYANKTNNIIRRYYYRNNTKLYNNHQRRLTKINYYTFIKGKSVKTGQKNYRNGKRTSYSVRLKNIPYYNQMTAGYPSGCEFFSLRMALAYKGINVSNAKLYNQMSKSMNRPKYNKKTKRWTWANPDKKFLGDPKGVMSNKANWGINPNGILPLARRYYKQAQAKQNFSTASIREELLKGNSVVVWASYNFQRPSGYFRYTDVDGNRRFTYNNFHVMLVTGMNDKYVFISDPILGRMKVSISRFNRAYRPYGRKALVV